MEGEKQISEVSTYMPPLGESEGRTGDLQRRGGEKREKRLWGGLCRDEEGG